MGVALDPVHKPYTQQDVDDGFSSELDKRRILMQKTFFLPESGEPNIPETGWGDEAKEKFLEDMRTLKEELRQARLDKLKNLGVV